MLLRQKNQVIEITESVTLTRKTVISQRSADSQSQDPIGEQVANPNISTGKWVAMIGFIKTTLSWFIKHLMGRGDG